MFPPIRKNGKGTRRIWKSAMVLITVVFHLFVFSVCLIPSFLYFSGLSFSVSGTHGRRCSHPTTPDTSCLGPATWKDILVLIQISQGRNSSWFARLDVHLGSIHYGLGQVGNITHETQLHESAAVLEGWVAGSSLINGVDNNSHIM